MNLSLYDLKILTLVALLETQPQLFTPEDQTSLSALIDQVPNETEEISNQIVTWYQERPKIEEAMLNFPGDENVILGPGGQEVPLNPEEYKETIKNAIRRSSNDGTKPQNQPPKS
ncbi:hypothetical protein [Gloeothece verrucosa]|uniref:Uncharacterized protein n=1 Tax=Gloeothece verrucosa (strain PCC 7822) TaxID=497965 RepID=E0UE04_GLOV7|nr:hypothetical protein [Gloeothece verrucosa]ADN13008.1 conserved hypothetical protein [Gloeothece verrucosa PCC 7822]